jgi:hypothetical protein
MNPTNIASDTRQGVLGLATLGAVLIAASENGSTEH